MRLVKSNLSKRVLVILLAFISVLFMFSNPLITHAVSGAALVRDTPTGTGPGGWGWLNTIRGFRIMAYEVSSPEDGTSKGYYDINGKKVSFKYNGKVADADDYTSNKWLYWCSEWKQSTAEGKTVWTQLGNETYRVSFSGYNGGGAKDLAKAVGLSNLSNPQAFFDALSSYDKYATNEDELADVFELPRGTRYVIVVEELIMATNSSGKCFCFTYGTWMNYSSAIKVYYNPKHSNQVSYSTATTYTCQGAIPPFKSGGYIFSDESKDRAAGYALFGDPGGGTVAAANVHVQYQGEPNTTDGEFKVAGSVIKVGKDDNGVYIGATDDDLFWFNPEDETWHSSNEWKVLSRIKDKGIIYQESSPYANIYADYYRTKVTSGFKVKTLVDRLNSLSGFTIEWGKTALTNSVTGTSKNVGYMILPKYLNGYDNTKGVMETITTVEPRLSLLEYHSNISSKNLTIIKCLKDTFNKAKLCSSDKLVGDVKLRKNNDFGIAIEFTAKSNSVTSHKVTIRMKDGVVLSNTETWSNTYKVAEFTKCTLDSEAVAYTVVPNSARNDGAVASALAGKTTAVQAKTALVDSIGNSNANDIACGGLNIGLGATSTAPIDGYTVYEVIMTPPLPHHEQGALDINSYMLNRYWENVIRTSSTRAGNLIWWQVNKDYTIIKEHYDQGKNCPRRGCWVFPTGATGETEDWRVEWRDASSGTTHTDWDNSMCQTYFPDMKTGVWSHSNRNDLASWVSEDTKDWSVPSGYIVDYGFNLVRAASGDKRSISGIHYQSYNNVDPSNVLQIKDQFGVVPLVVFNGGAGIRQADLTDGSRLATTTEKLFMQSRFTRYSGSGYSIQSNNHHHAEEGHTEYGTGGTPPNTYPTSWWVVDKPEVNITYYTFTSRKPLGYLMNDTFASNTLTYEWTNSYYKYRSAIIPDGINTVLGSTATAHKAISTAAKTSISSGHVGGTNEYRFANVRYNGVTLSFYPEVKMVYKLGGTTWSQVSSTDYTTVYTMGECPRNTKSSSLYLFKLNGNGDGSITGTTYSDAMQGGSNTLGNTKVMIPAGSDVNVAADMNGINIDLYAYALDVIDKSVDSPSFKNSATTTKSYEEVVESGDNVYQKWMKVSNIDILKNHFLNWTNDILNVENFGADFELKVNGSTKSENFGATIGYIQRNTTITEDGVYQLVVSNGVLDTSSGDYSKMITQIAADYECSEAEATQIWNASGIYTAILEAIESSTSSFNNSGVCSVNPSWTSMLGNSSNWYDEKTRTFVVRRFTNLDNKFCDIIASDKIDYNLAPSGVLNDKQNANAGNTANANWTVTIYFDNAKSSDVNDYLLDSGTYYTPNTGTSTSGSSNFVTANSSHTILINKAPVKNADFLIPASSTSDFGY